MIAILLFAGAFLFTGSMIFMVAGTKKTVWVTIGFILTVGSVLLMILNYNQYLGMKEVSVSHEYPLTSSLKGQKRVLLYRHLGTKDERVYFYKNNPLESKLARTDPEKGSVKLTQNASHNRLIVTKTYRVYRNEELRLLFSVGVKNHDYVKTNWHFNLKPGWRVIAMPAK
ncbi:DUF4811 domain-containing protein [Lactobacillus sp. LC28-10]|uniref:DUF4811 domain-containing protein n=1 Tax=Secundilactobacillus angelensis TaxID=2722706 RepID=A0ABX1KW10_9LACO|nr:DUF4811 domain-containing protein [Secundilactobacillus angelensis]MCH5462426.1 DUF4811 domain-containing protein [Secundilactobacillus angelensis]NLR18092.1 DUF4811 domain-containing protein [Secundilactobacillus angelensis]